MIYKLPDELQISIFKKLRYKDAINLSKVSKKYYDLFTLLKKKEKIIKFKIKDDIKILLNNIYLNYRYIKINNIYYRIINVSVMGIIIKLILRNGDIIYIDDRSININKNRKHIENIDFIVKSPFNIKLNELQSIKNKILYFNKL